MPMTNLNHLGSFFTRKKGATYQQGRSEYYKVLNVLSSNASVESLKQIKFSKEKSLPVPIRCYGVVFEATEKEIHKKLGRANYRQQQVLGVPQLTTLFYKLKIKGLRCILEIHLYKGSVFCLHLLMKDGSQDERNEFLNSLAKLYKTNKIDWGDKVIGKNRNELYCQNDVIPKLTFLTSNKNYLENILADMRPKEKEIKSGYTLRQLDWRMS